ncbi:hypothetical protein GQ44DRAFT_704395 [Phaeosphaeriaceae sp. PMI808]|nr:hypothetical protein GQ44DRAFT_720742 [Phaeosphaeriaceae sp. PMI808]KAH8727442.1 hypothetical protein GQ44DRAFT_704395 [Phaeosphaeriaceae sp. PMI808]
MSIGQVCISSLHPISVANKSSVILHGNTLSHNYSHVAYSIPRLHKHLSYHRRFCDRFG